MRGEEMSEEGGEDEREEGGLGGLDIFTGGFCKSEGKNTNGKD